MAILNSSISKIFKYQIVVRFIVALLTVLVASVAIAQDSKSQYKAPGWGDLSYVPPAPGTYELPVIMQAHDGKVIRTDGTEANLFEIMSGKLVFLSFIFTRCADTNGCPLANAVLYKVQGRLNQRPELADKVALLSVSFDPEFDTPEVTGKLENVFQSGQVQWEFLTTESQAALQPILDNYGQFVLRLKMQDSTHGHSVDETAHILKVYLIDRERNVRNIYSVSFLHPDILMNDLDTLVLESAT